MQILPVLLLAAAVAGAQDPPAKPLGSGELSRLVEFADDAGILVEAARELDLQQQALIESEKEQIGKLAAQGRDDLAEKLAATVVERIRLIEQAWEFVMRRYPNNARAKNYYGEALYDLRGRHREGEHFWKLALALDKDLSAAYNNLGLHYMHSGMYDQGLVHMGKALKLEPKNPDYLFNMVQVYLNHFPELEKRYKMPKKKLYREAMKLSKNATKYAPDDYEILADYAMNFYAAENFGLKADWEDAAEAWERAGTRATTRLERFYTTLNEGRTWLRAKKWDRAEARFKEALELEPESSVVRELLNKSKAKKS